jgi:hypothetical protein
MQWNLFRHGKEDIPQAPQNGCADIDDKIGREIFGKGNPGAL